MRIISGSVRGRKLAEFAGSGIRPTSDRAREAIFSMLVSRFVTLQKTKILDLFAGSGALSLEALSRGATSAILVDSSSQAAKLINDNICRCKMESQAVLINQPVLAALIQLENKGPFDIIFMDPPYNKGLITQALEQIASLQLLRQNGILFAESGINEQFELPESFELITARNYGKSRIHLIGNHISTDDKTMRAT